MPVEDKALFITGLPLGRMCDKSCPTPPLRFISCTYSALQTKVQFLSLFFLQKLNEAVNVGMFVEELLQFVMIALQIIVAALAFNKFEFHESDTI